MTRDWDAATYDKLPLPHENWGVRVIESLTLQGRETVLDAGCGTGRDSIRLLERHPGVRVIAVDASPNMLQEFRRKVSPHERRIEWHEADLVSSDFKLGKRAHAAFSVATFHWIQDHDALFRNLASVTVPGGQLVFECGGQGNITQLSRAMEEVGLRDATIWNFAGIEDTQRRLEAAGFKALEVRLRPDPVRLQPGSQMETFLSTVILGSHLQRMSPHERLKTVRLVAAELLEPVIDYVRLEVVAVRA